MKRLGIQKCIVVTLFAALAFTMQLAAQEQQRKTVADRITGAVDSSQMVRLARNVHPKVQPAFDQGAVDPGFQLRYMTLLTVPTAHQQKELNKLLAEQQNPASANYLKWLTPEQYAERFGLSQGDLSKITNWLRSQGFKVLGVARGRNWVAFSGTAGQVAHAFRTEIHRYDVDGEMHFANATAPSVPAALAGLVAGFRGLDDFRMKPATSRRLRGDYFAGSTFFQQELAPGDIAAMYDLNPLYATGIDGTGQTQAVMGQSDIYLADIQDFRAGFGLSAITGCTTDANGIIIDPCDTANFKYVLVGTDPGSPNAIADDLAEADLDLEWSGAVARNAQIIYVNAPDPSGGGVMDAAYYAIDNLIAPVISFSYGTCEMNEVPYLAADEAELQMANSEGVTFVSASGDTGAAACDSPTNGSTNNQAVSGLAVSWPASSPSVTGVGGTAVPFADFNSTYWGTSNGSDGGSALGYVPEQAWNDSSEIVAYCVANPAVWFCSSYGVSVQTAQAWLGINSTGGGASNCTTTSGGSCTGGFPQPSWQTATVPGQASARFVPDVSMPGTPNFPGYIICIPLSELGYGTTTSSCDAGNGGIGGAIGYNTIFGGTSVSAQAFGGMVTLLNQYVQGTSAAGLGNINPTLYELAKTTPNNYFHVLTSGGNQVACVPGTPSGQPVSLQCPQSGILGYDASNYDTNTGYNLVVGLGSVDLANLAAAWETSRTATTATIQAWPTSVNQGDNVTLTATVSPASATGNVSFFNNNSTTALGTSALSGGTAVFQTTSLPIGTNSITASYAGDASNAPSTTTAAAVVTVAAPSFAVTNTGATSQTASAGTTSPAYTFTAAPAGGAPLFASAVTFTCSFAPTDPTLTNSSCVFTPASIAAGQGSTGVQLNVVTVGPNTTSGPIQQQHRRADNRSPWLPLAFPLAGIVAVGLAGRKLSRYSIAASLCVALMLAGFLIACGSSSHPLISISNVSANPAAVYPNNAGWPSQTSNLSVSLTNDSANKGVTWSAAKGSIVSTGPTTATYTAPTIAAGLPASDAITATSVADTSKTGNGSVTLNPATVPGTYTVTVTASEQNATDQTLQYTLVVQ